MIHPPLSDNDNEIFFSAKFIRFYDGIRKYHMYDIHKAHQRGLKPWHIYSNIQQTKCKYFKSAEWDSAEINAETLAG